MSAPHVDTIEQLIHRANAAIKKYEDYQVTAGRTLAEFKDRITDKTKDEGAPWSWNWTRFVHQKLDCSYSHAQRLISYVYKDDPDAAVAAERKTNATRERERRQRQKDSHTCENVEVETAAPVEQMTVPEPPEATESVQHEVIEANLLRALDRLHGLITDCRIADVVRPALKRHGPILTTARLLVFEDSSVPWQPGNGPSRKLSSTPSATPARAIKSPSRRSRRWSPDSSSTTT